MKNGPLVSILIPTYNRSRYLPCAIKSALSQEYPNIEVIVVRDGGEKINDIIGSFSDSRLVFIDRDENRGIPHTLNQGLVAARGKYICYLGDDDILYPNHVETLLDVLETKTDCLAAYTDLYRVSCTNPENGYRQVLSKVLEVSRNFDRYMMLYFNHVLHVSMMHRRDLIEKTGFYNEKLNILVDWDIFRRLVFFTDFYHVRKITGEYYSPVTNSDRVSVKNRKDPQKYLYNVMTIRATRPPKPWSKLKDLAIIIDTPALTQSVGDTIRAVWEETVYPCLTYIPMAGQDISRLNIALPNIVPVETNASTSQQRIMAALAQCDAEYAMVIPAGFPVKAFWVEDCMHAINQASLGRSAFEIEGSCENAWGGVFDTDVLKSLLSQNWDGSLYQMVKAAGFNIHRPQPENISFQYDQFLDRGRNLLLEKKYAQAANMFEYIANNYGNEFWLGIIAAQAHLKCGNLQRAKDISSRINEVFPNVESFITMAMAEKESKNYARAAELFSGALNIIEGKQQVWV